MNPTRRLLQEAFTAAVTAVDPRRLVSAELECVAERLRWRDREVRLPRGRLVVLGAGKGAARMAAGLEALLGNRIDGGVVAVKAGHAEPLETIAVRECGHPIPDQASAQAGQELLRRALGCGENDLVLFCLTGGASALAVAPAEIPLQDKIRTNEVLVGAGASIAEINSVRKHLSLLKGGQLLRAARPAGVLTLALSDVIGNDPSTIGSGPTVPDPTTFADCLETLERYGLMTKLAPSVRLRLSSGSSGERTETPKPEEFPDALESFWLLGDLDDALDAAASHLASKGVAVERLERPMTGNTHEEAGALMALARGRQAAGFRGVVLAGGETTLEVTGTGRGGRNQEFALAAAQHLAGTTGISLLAAGTDGTDGPTDAAGAYADPSTLERLAARGIDVNRVLGDNDAYPALQALGDLLITGPTLTNVADIALVDIR